MDYGFFTTMREVGFPMPMKYDESEMIWQSRQRNDGL